jgi:EAL domain-containing protein (putative c-di-GMP-specific phosphodiesterase class I)
MYAMPTREYVSLTADVQRTFRTRELIEELLAHPRQLGPDYQPIRRLDDRVVVGYKATGRGRAGTELADTLALLQEAQALGLVERIDWAFRALAFEDFTGRPDVELHLTPEPETYGTLCPPPLAAAFGRARRELTVAAEIHAATFADPTLVRRGAAELRDWGWLLVAADVADDAAALDQLTQLRPDVVQIDLSLPGRTAEPTHSGVRRLLAVAAESGARLMALHVDSTAAVTAARALGCVSGRGSALGEPGPIPPG